MNYSPGQDFQKNRCLGHLLAEKKISFSNNIEVTEEEI